MASMMTSEEIREAFLSYFESKGHLRMASGSLIPVGDPTLLLTNAGMVPFKAFFAGEAEPPNVRLTSSQKSFRTPDIDEVGDATHLTLFEMMGNFSFGDYFKEDAIKFALEFLDTRLGLPKEKFSIAVHESDDEAEALWLQAGIPKDRIFRFGDEHNWWGPAGNEGPCGPNTELFYDFGDDRGCAESDCGPNCEHIMNEQGEVCDRFVELWNLVFMQFYHNLDGSRTPLPAPGVDTGLGLERTVVILQGVSTIYETDLFQPMIKKAEELTGKKWGSDRDTRYAIATMAEHGRSSTFLIADGVIPGNEGRGYVLRRVIRRAIRHARKLGLDGPFLGELVQATIDKMGGVFPELRNNQEFILTVIKLEEERFQQAFQNGYNLLTEALAGASTLSGEVMFRLWDTYGFPVEMTQEIAEEQGVAVDMDGFRKEMAAQRERGRASAQFGGGDRAKIRVYESLGVGATRFQGYEQLTGTSPVIGLLANDEAVNEVTEGQDVEVVLLDTPFYAEGGGQVGDAGEIVSANGKIEVHDTQAVMPDMIVHFGKVTQGSVAMGDSVDTYVDTVRREDTARNHTATHLLHAALRQVLGPHVRQAGSLVAPDRLRFDFSHMQAVTDDEMRQVQWLVNERVRQNARVIKDEDTYTSAIERGALAFFGDKYGERVRLVEIANGETFSFEVCGGTHVGHTGEVGSVYILSEASIGAGMRRLEAVTGRAAERMVWERFHREERLAQLLQTPQSELETRVQGLLDEVEALRQQMGSLERQSSLQAAAGLLNSKREVNGITVLAARTEASNADSLREVSDWLRDKLGSGIVVLGALINDRPTINVGITADLVENGADAREYAKELGRVIGGGGGGSAKMAQAGGRQPDKLDEAINGAVELVRQKTS
ncbi:MAG: alanine--tRNA ligase [Chloroflexi bacterium]|nr:alanine--tRNA ligase [Chloroflexota bacterium]